MNANMVVGAVAVIVGAAYLLQALHIPKATIGNPWAPMLFPLGLGVLMVVLGAYLFISTWIKEKRFSTGERKPPDRDFLKLMAGTIVACIAYAFLFDRAGFVVSTLLFLGSILFLVNGRKAWVTNLIVDMAFTFIIWYVFTDVLKISLP